MEHHGDVFHQAVQLVVSHIMTANANRAVLHIPEPCNQITEGGFSSAGGTDDSRGGSSGDREADVVQNFALPVGETDIPKGDGSIRRHQFLPVNIHRGRVVNGICLIHGCPQHLQIVGHIAGALQFPEDHKRDHQHQKAASQRQGSRTVKCQCGQNNSGAEQMNHKLPQSKPGRRRFFQGQSLAAALVYCPACGLAGVPLQAIGFDYGHALDILQYRRHQIHLRMLPGRGGLPHGPLAQFCHTQITEDTADCKQSEPPVGYEQGQTQRQCVQEPADHHDQAPGGGVLHIPQSGRDHGGDIA